MSPVASLAHLIGQMSFEDARSLALSSALLERGDPLAYDEASDRVAELAEDLPQAGQDEIVRAIAVLRDRLGGLRLDQTVAFLAEGTMSAALRAIAVRETADEATYDLVARPVRRVFAGWL